MTHFCDGSRTYFSEGIGPLVNDIGSGIPIRDHGSYIPISQWGTWHQEEGAEEDCQ